MRFVATADGQTDQVEISGQDGHYHVTVDGQTFEVDARRIAEGAYSLLIEGVSYLADIGHRRGGLSVQVAGHTCVVEVEEEIRHRIRTLGGVAGTGSAQTVSAPLPGKVTHVAVTAGQAVKPGDTLLVIEAMKMENEFKAPAAGTVAEVRVQPGQAVNAGDVLVIIG